MLWKSSLVFCACKEFWERQKDDKITRLKDNETLIVLWTCCLVDLFNPFFLKKTDRDIIDAYFFALSMLKVKHKILK